VGGPGVKGHALVALVAWHGRPWGQKARTGGPSSVELGCNLLGLYRVALSTGGCYGRMICNSFCGIRHDTNKSTACAARGARTVVGRSSGRISEPQCSRVEVLETWRTTMNAPLRFSRNKTRVTKSEPGLAPEPGSRAMQLSPHLTDSSSLPREQHASDHDPQGEQTGS
jgi:hypothetical protein